jgi:hypothetical protein
VAAAAFEVKNPDLAIVSVLHRPVEDSPAGGDRQVMDISKQG